MRLQAAGSLGASPLSPVPIRLATALALLLAAPAALARTLDADRLGTFSTGIFDDGAAETAAYDAASETLFFVNAAASEVVALDASDSFQRVVVEALVEGVTEAVAQTGVRAVAVVGGVSANRGLRAAVTEAGAASGFEVYVPDLAHSVDNAAMIAVTAAFKWAAGETSGLDVGVTPSLAL